MAFFWMGQRRLCGVCSFLFLLLLWQVSDALAGAWTMKKRSMYNRFAFNYYHTTRIYRSQGDSVAMSMSGRFIDRNWNWYEEYGLTDRITLISSLYYKWLDYRDSYVSRESYGIGDAEVGAKYLIWRGPVVVSLQGLFKYGELYEGDDPPLGNGQNDFELRLLLGRSLWPFPAYCGLEAGYRWRAGAPADEVRALFEIGANFTKKFYARIKLDATIGVGNGDVSSAATPQLPVGSGPDATSLFSKGATPPPLPGSAAEIAEKVSSLTETNPNIASEFHLLKADVVIGYQLENGTGFEIGYAPTLWGENTSKGAIYSVAFIHSW